MSGVYALARRMASGVTRRHALRSKLRRLALSGRLPQPVWRRLPPNEDTLYVGFPDGTGFRYGIELEDPFARELFWRGLASPEGFSIAAFHEVARCARVVVDVGAHTGLYALTALAAGTTVRVEAFEPVAENVEVLKGNLLRNGWSNRCNPRPVAVSNYTGTAELHVPFGPHPMSASLGAGGFRGLAGEVRQVPVTTVGAELGLQAVDLVKIDVEGLEDVVLEGMATMLDRWRPVVMVEANPDGPIEQIEDILRPLRYCFRHLAPNAPPPGKRIVADATEIYRNYLCVPES